MGGEGSTAAVVDYNDDDLAQLEAGHVRALRWLVFRPSRYTQRVVERLRFLPRGGELWQRDVQIRIPSRVAQPEDGRFVVSLGMFRRCRFPDFEARDADGRRLNLLTRRQHQHCMAIAMLRQYLSDEDWARANEDAYEQQFDMLYHRLATLITDIKGLSGVTPTDVREALESLLSELGKSPAEIDRATQLLESDCDLLKTHTHYLCWVPAKVGETVALSASYTMSDTVRLAGKPRKLAKEDEAAGESEWRRRRMRGYARFSLNPVYYELRAPAHDHTGSYYFTVDPPEEAHVPFLDWDKDHCFGSATPDVDCAHMSCHIYNGERSVAPDASDEAQRESISGSRMSAFVKADAVDHALLFAVAVLNGGLAFLAQNGALLAGPTTGQAQWLLLAPAVLVAFIAQHRRRYYSQVTRPVRAIMWAYLGLSGLFAASVAFNVFGRDRYDDLTAGAMALMSAGLIALVVFSGGLYERVTRRLYEWRVRKLDADDHGDHAEGGEDPERKDLSRETYLWAARWYGDASVAAIVTVLVAMLVVMLSADWGEGRRDKADRIERAEMAAKRDADRASERVSDETTRARFKTPAPAEGSSTTEVPRAPSGARGSRP